MGSPKKARVSAEKRSELQVAAAVAREALLHSHVQQALELIGLAGNRVSVLRMLDIYVRVNMLPHSDAERVTSRALATLGETMHAGERPLMYVEGEAGAGLTENLPLVGIVRERLRGRSLNDLRHWVELHTGRTQVLLLNVYVSHALRFVELLHETHSTAAALRVFSEFIDVPKAMADMLDMFVLDRLSADGLPGAPAATVQLMAGGARPRSVKPPAAERRRKEPLDNAAP